METTEVLGDTEGSRKRGKLSIQYIDSVKGAIGVSLLGLGRAVENRTLWLLLIHRVTKSQSPLA